MFEIRNTIKTSVKSKLNVKGLINDAKDSSNQMKNKQAGSAVKEQTSKNEFIKRYNNIKLVLYALLLFIVVTILIIPFNLDLISIVICLLASSIFGMIYFRYSFTAWRARLVFKNWDNRHEDFTVDIQDFSDAISLNFRNILPLNIKGDTNV